MRKKTSTFLSGLCSELPRFHGYVCTHDIQERGEGRGGEGRRGGGGKAACLSLEVFTEAETLPLTNASPRQRRSQVHVGADHKLAAAKTLAGEAKSARRLREAQRRKKRHK